MRRVLLALAVVALVATASGGTVIARSPIPPAYQIVNVGAYGGEPSIVSDSSGYLYDITPSGGTITYRSTDRGATWQQTTTADSSSGDDCLATD